MERKIAQKQRESKEERLRELAQKARDERAGIRTEGGGGDDESEKEREQLRYDRHKERERARRIAKANPNKRYRRRIISMSLLYLKCLIRSKLDRDKDRDISEKIALGMPGAPPSNESMFDQRLFNTSQVLYKNLTIT